MPFIIFYLKNIIIQEPATGPFPEPDKSSPCSYTLHLKTHLNVILPSVPRSSRFSN